jgi:Domain of unknown function (DUF5602)
MSYRRPFVAALLALTLAGCGDPSLVRFFSGGPLPGTIDGKRVRTDDPFARREYGPAMPVGNGVARTYVVFSEANHAVPLEIGVSLTEGALEGLPGKNPHAAHMKAASAHEHLDNHIYLLSLPARAAAPYRFVELDWNPGGHEPPGIYDQPHFDFHFYTIAREERASIVPSDSQFQKKADMLPPEAERPPFYAMAAPPGAPAPGVPLMGVHWIDVRSPELQKMMGKPEAYRPFTTTFIYGSWAGRFTFVEPMITRAYILSKKTAGYAERDEVIPVPMAKQYSPAGYYPSAYRITWDPRMKEYRIALTHLAWRGDGSAASN